VRNSPNDRTFEEIVLAIEAHFRTHSPDREVIAEW
jgi:hypothetical protein